MFLRNVSIAGGYLLLVANGPGPLSHWTVESPSNDATVEGNASDCSLALALIRRFCLRHPE